MLENVAGVLLGHLGPSFGLGLHLIDLLGHAVEGLEGACIREAAHRLLDALHRFSAPLARNQNVLLSLGLADLVIEGLQGRFELIGERLLTLPLLLILGRDRVVLLLSE